VASPLGRHRDDGPWLKCVPKSINLLVGALGGDGGGVLCDWIVAAAHAHGLGVQATQILPTF